MSDHPIERIGALAPGTGWFALYVDEKEKTAHVLPLVAWAGITEVHESREEFCGVSGMVAFDHEISEASQGSGFVGFYDETQALIEVKRINGKGYNIDTYTARKLRPDRGVHWMKYEKDGGKTSY